MNRGISLLLYRLLGLAVEIKLIFIELWDKVKW